MFPAIHTESETVLGYLDEMLDGIRSSAHGLSEEQARSTPCRSALSIAGIIKHCTWVMSSVVGGRTTEPGSADGAAEFMASFTPTEQETLEDLLTRFDQTRTAYLQAMGSLDPEATMVVAPKPWEDIHESHEASTRLLMVHHVDEFARHAGHADIIREQLDGADAMGLLFAVEGRPGNQFVQPWQPS